MAQAQDLGALYLHDGVTALPEGAVTGAQMEWLQLRVQEAGGEATLWEARPGTAAEEGASARRTMRDGGCRALAVAALAVGAAAGATLGPLLVLRVVPATARYLIPLGGMVIGNSMNAAEPDHAPRQGRRGRTAGGGRGGPGSRRESPGRRADTRDGAQGSPWPRWWTPRKRRASSFCRVLWSA
jgi:hypothetical protein